MKARRFPAPLLALACIFAPSASAATTFVAIDGAARGCIDGMRTVRRVDYGSFVWLEVEQVEVPAIHALGAGATVVDAARFVQVPGFRFDPLADGEPALEPTLRADPRAAGFRLVQFVGPLKDEWLAATRAAGLEPLQYYPHDAYLAWGAPQAADALARLPFVRWVGAFHPAYKLNADLAGRAGPVSNVDVMIYDDGHVAETLAAIGKLGGTIVQTYPAQPDRAFLDAIVELDGARTADVARLENVLWLGYSSPTPGLEDEMSCQIVAGNHPGGVPVTGYTTFLATLGFDGAGVIWSTTDTGVDYDHPDLGGHIVGGYSYPGACNTNPGEDCSGGGHGTHVTGIIGGDATAGFTDPSGFLYGLGIAPGYSIFAQNALSAPAWPPTGGWQEMTKRGVLGGAVGANNSWTTGEGTAHGYQASERTHDFAVRDGNFDTASVAEPYILVFSAGNSGPGSQTLTSPKEAKNLIVTAASLNYRVGSIDSIASFSSRGPAVDGRTIPTITAPGDQIASARNDLGGLCATAIGGTSNLYAYCSGTSMASPHASGMVVLLTQWWRTFNAGADPSPAMAKALLVNGAVDMTGPGAIPNFIEGWGRIDIPNVIGTSVPTVYRDQTDVLAGSGDEIDLNVTVPNPGQPMKLTIVWSDAPGAVGANPALVNDLDLSVQDGATTYVGNVFSGGWSVSGGSADTLNNVENVFIQSPGTTLAVKIRATNIAGDGIPLNADTTDQDFALVCTNCTVSGGCPTITLAPGSPLPNGGVSLPYSVTLSATGGVAPYTFAVTAGTLPPGLSLASNGDLAGIPTTPGTWSFTATATDQNGCTGSRIYDLTIDTTCVIVSITPAMLPDGSEGVPYGSQLTASGGTAPYTFAATGTLPPGISLSLTGLLSGTPTTAGSYAFDVTATDANGCMTPPAPPRQAFTIDIHPAVDYAVGRGLGQPNTNDVRVYARDGVATSVTFFAYAAGQWGTNVGGGDIDGATYGEVLTGPGPGAVYGPQVRAFDRTGQPIQKVNFYAYGTLRFGVNVGSAELEGDGYDEILSGAGRGAVFGPHVRGFNYDGATLTAVAKVSFFAYQTLKYGVNVEDGDVDADVYAEILTGPGPGAIFGPQVRGFDYDGTGITAINKINFNAYTATFHGVNLAGGDIDTDGYAEIATVQGSGPYIADYRLWNYDGSAISQLTGFTLQPFGGSFGGRVGLADLSGDGAWDLLAAAGPDPTATASVSGYDVSSGAATQISTFTPFTSGYGANVAGGALGFW